MEVPSRTWANTCIVTYTFALLVLGLELSLLGPTTGAFAEKLGVDETALLPLYTVSGLLGAIGALAAGYLVDRYPGHYVLAFTLLSQAVGLWCMPYCSTLHQLLIAYALPSSTFNFINIGCNSLAAWAKPKNPGPYLNLIGGGFGVGSFLAPALAYACVTHLGTSLAAFQVNAVLAVVFALPLFFLRSPVCDGVYHHAPASPTLGASTHRQRTLSAALQEEGVGKPLLLPPSSGDLVDFVFTAQELDAYSVESTVVKRVSWHLASACAMLLLLSVGTSTGLGAWIHTYVLREAHLPRETAVTANSVYWGAVALGCFLWTPLAAHLQPTAMILPGLNLSTIGMLPLVFVPGACFSHIAVMYAALTCIGLGIAPIFANAYSLLARYSLMAGSPNALVSSAAGLGTMIIPPFLAYAVDSKVLNPHPGSFQIVMTCCLWLYLLQIVVAVWAEFAGRLALRRSCSPPSSTAAREDTGVTSAL